VPFVKQKGDFGLIGSIFGRMEPIDPYPKFCSWAERHPQQSEGLRFVDGDRKVEYLNQRTALLTSSQCHVRSELRVLVRLTENTDASLPMT
jgi:hypothetical protein